jgi:hypothetical protein
MKKMILAAFIASISVSTFACLDQAKTMAKGLMAAEFGVSVDKVMMMEGEKRSDGKIHLSGIVEPHPSTRDFIFTFMAEDERSPADPKCAIQELKVYPTWID